MRIQAWSAVTIFVGIMFWSIVGPNLALLGVASSPDHSWTFFQAHPWLSGPRSLVETPQPRVTATYWLGTVTSLIGFFAFFVGTLAAFKGEKTWIFWIGLMTLGLSSVALFSILGISEAIGQTIGETWFRPS